MGAINCESVTITGKFPFSTGGLQEMYTDFDRWVVKFSKIMQRSLNSDKKGVVNEQVHTLRSNDALKDFPSDFLQCNLHSLALYGQQKNYKQLKSLTDQLNIDVNGAYDMFYDYALFRLCNESFRFVEYRSKL